MSVTLTITETRQDPTVPFFNMPADWITYVQKYNNVRLGNGGVYIFSDDKLTRTSKTVFVSQEAADQFAADETVRAGLKLRDEHNAANNITRTNSIS